MAVPLLSLLWGALTFLSGQCVVSSAAISTIPLIPHHAQVRRRLGTSTIPSRPSGVRRREEAQEVGALYHGYGTHYMDLWCGTPPQRQTVIVGTGGEWTGFPCSGCQDCGAPYYHIDNYFKEEESSTFSQIPCGQCSASNFCVDTCDVSMNYAEGSIWRAFEAKDNCYLGGPHNVALPDDLPDHTEDIDPDHASHFAFDLRFGCQTSVTGLFKTQLADGIMGMSDSPHALWQQLYDAGELGPLAQFSLCFARPPGESRDGTEAGALTLGGVDTRLHDTEMVYIVMRAKRSNMFEATLRAIYLRHGKGGESAKTSDSEATLVNLNIEGGSNVVGVESGTTDTYWSREIRSAFESAFKDLSGMSYSNDPMSLTEDEMKALPTILFQFEGDPVKNAVVAAGRPGLVGLAADIDPSHPHDVVWAMPPSHYMELRDDGRYIPRFYMTEPRNPLIGANAMMGHDVLIDASNRRFGLAESTCDYHKLITDAGYTDVLEETEIGTGDTTEDSPSNDVPETGGQGTDIKPIGGDLDVEESGGGQAGVNKEDLPDDSTLIDKKPLGDTEKASSGVAGTCSSNAACRGVVAMVSMVVIGTMSYYTRRTFTSHDSRQLVPSTELEMTSNDFSTDAGTGASEISSDHYGEFETKGMLS